MENKKFEFKQGTYGDYITFNGKELSKDEILKILNDKQLNLGAVSSSCLVDMAEQMQKENQAMIKGAKGHDSLAYYKGIDLGIDRIIRLIKRNYG